MEYSLPNTELFVSLRWYWTLVDINENKINYNLTVLKFSTLTIFKQIKCLKFFLRKVKIIKAQEDSNSSLTDP